MKSADSSGPDDMVGTATNVAWAWTVAVGDGLGGRGVAVGIGVGVESSKVGGTGVAVDCVDKTAVAVAVLVGAGEARTRTLAVGDTAGPTLPSPGLPATDSAVGSPVSVSRGSSVGNAVGLEVAV